MSDPYYYAFVSHLSHIHAGRYSHVSYSILLLLLLSFTLWKCGPTLHLHASIPAQGSAVTMSDDPAQLKALTTCGTIYTCAISTHCPITKTNTHCVIKVVTFPLGLQGACLDLVCAYRNSPLLPAHKSYVTSMWQGHIYIDR